MDSKERSCDCENCSMEESDATDGKLMCSKSCYPDSAFEELFLKLRTCSGPGIQGRSILHRRSFFTILLRVSTWDRFADSCSGLCEEITEKERNEIIRVTDDRNKCSPLKTKVTCQDYLKINLIDWVHWVIRIEWNQDEFAKYQENKYGTYSQGSSNHCQLLIGNYQSVLRNSYYWRPEIPI